MICEINMFDSLLLVTIILAVISFVYFDYEVLHPIVVMNSVMAISVLFGFFNVDKWQLTIQFSTFLFIVFGMIAYNIGGIIAKQKHVKININYKAFDVSTYKIIGSCFLMMALLAFSISEMYNLSIKAGNTEGWLNMIKPTRFAIEKGILNVSRWMNYRYYIASSIAFVNVYFLYRNIIVAGFQKKYLQYICPIICYIPFSVLTTGRRDIVHFVIANLTIGGIIYLQKHLFSVEAKIKLIKSVLAASCISVVLFLSLGTLTGKVSLIKSDFFRVLSHYLGLSFPALDRLINGLLIENQFVAQNTLLGLYSNLVTLGFPLEKGRSFLKFVYFDGINTNVYSVFGRQYMDFGFCGTIILSLGLGIFISYSYYYITNRSDAPILLSMYGLFGYVPFFLFIDDQFMGIFNTKIIYQYFLISIIFFIYSNGSIDSINLNKYIRKFKTK